MAKFTANETGCWEWESSLDPRGYGVFSEKNVTTGGKMKRYFAHRLVYELLVGPIPEGLVIDHLCRNPKCVRPDHLEPVTQGENVRRGNIAGSAKSRREARLIAVTHCKYGHDYATNGVVRSDGLRVCRACNREKMRKSRARKALTDNLRKD